ANRRVDDGACRGSADPSTSRGAEQLGHEGGQRLGRAGNPPEPGEGVDVDDRGTAFGLDQVDAEEVDGEGDTDHLDQLRPLLGYLVDGKRLALDRGVEWGRPVGGEDLVADDPELDVPAVV